MPVFSYVNGQYLHHSNAAVHIEDRGFQFADSIYEVIACINGTLADAQGHIDRLERSLKELQMYMPCSRKALEIIIFNLLRKNRLKNAAVYIQITRGAAKRDFKFPASDTQQTLVITTRSFDFSVNPYMEKGAKAITVPDQRWVRRDIKTTGLLAQALAKQEAAQKGAQEALMLDDKGFITEGSSSNCWMLKGKTLYTRKANHNILKGVTRMAVAHVAKKRGLKIIEKSFKPADLLKADEVFNTSATSLVMPVVNINGKKIAKGQVGFVTQDIYREYLNYINGKHGSPLSWKY